MIADPRDRMPREQITAETTTEEVAQFASDSKATRQWNQAERVRDQEARRVKELRRLTEQGRRDRQLEQGGRARHQGQ